MERGIEGERELHHHHHNNVVLSTSEEKIHPRVVYYSRTTPEDGWQLKRLPLAFHVPFN